MTREESWSGLREFIATGRYFELLSTENAVDVAVYSARGELLHDERGVESGYYIDRRGVEPFARIEIRTGAAETVKFIVTDGLSGSKSAPSTISDDASTRTAYVQDGVSLGAVDAQLLAANTNRKLLVIQNQDAAVAIYVTFDGSAATADRESFKIAAGGHFEPRVVPTGEVRAISASGNVDVHVIEG